MITGEAGKWMYTQRLCPATATLAGGPDAKVTFQRDTDRFSIESPIGRDIQVSVRDRLIVECQSAPELRMVQLKTQ